MSLCIAINNPSNYVMIAGDGRIMKGKKVISDNHKKLTRLTNKVSIFCSGAQDYCEELRIRIAHLVNEETSIDKIALIVQKESLLVHLRFILDYPTYYVHEPTGSGLAIILAYFDVEKNQSGFIQYSHSDGFEPHVITSSEVVVRGIGQQNGLDFLVNHFNPNQAVESLLDTFDFVGALEERVGGNITVHILSRENITEFERGQKI